jgi:hypothetical protein
VSVQYFFSSLYLVNPALLLAHQAPDLLPT